MTNILHLDTSRRGKVRVSLNMSGYIVHLKGKSKKWMAQQLLLVIDELLQKQKVNVEQLDRIEVNSGPGSFTGLRVGVAVANAMGWVLNIVVNDNEIGKIAVVRYA